MLQEAVNSWRRNSARNNRATVLERRRADVVEKNFFASESGIFKVTRSETSLFRPFSESQNLPALFPELHAAGLDTCDDP